MSNEQDQGIMSLLKDEKNQEEIVDDLTKDSEMELDESGLEEEMSFSCPLCDNGCDYCNGESLNELEFMSAQLMVQAQQLLALSDEIKELKILLASLSKGLYFFVMNEKNKSASMLHKIYEEVKVSMKTEAPKETNE